MSLLCALSFIPQENKRTLLVASLVSPLFRLGLLRSTTITLGACDYKLTEDRKVYVLLKREVSPRRPEILIIPNFAAAVHFEAKDVSVALIDDTLAALGERRFCCIEIDFTDEPDTEEQTHLASCLARPQQIAERISVSFLRSSGNWIAGTALRRVELYAFMGEMEELFNFFKGTQVEAVQIINTQTFTSEASLLSNLPTTVVDLRLDGSNCRDALFSDVSRCAQLQRLSVDYCRELSELNVSEMTSLQSLSAAHTNLNCDALLGLSNCVGLRLLNLSGCRELHDVSALQSLRNLRELFIHETNVTNVGIAGLSNCAALEKLNLGGCTGVSDVNFVASLPNLKELHLWMTRVRTEGIVGLSRCVSLVEVVFDGCSRLSNVNVLGGLRQLRFVSLSQTNVDMEGIAALEECAVLETLDVRGTRIEKPPKLFLRDAVVAFFRQSHQEVASQ